VKLKTIVTSVAAAGFAVAGSVYAAGNSNTDAQLKALTVQVQQLQTQLNAMANSGAKSGAKSGGSGSFVGINSEFTKDMLNNQDTVNRELTILQHRADGSIAANTITLGGKGEIYTDFQRVGSKNNSSINLPAANIAFTATAGDWVTAFLNLQVSNPQSTTVMAGGTQANGDSVYLNDAYLVFGNLNVSPFYAWGGKKTIDFGDFSTPSTLTPSMLQSFFLASGGQLGAGYHQELARGQAVTATFTVMNGGGEAQYNSVTPSGQINNFAANVRYDGTLSKDLTFHAGGGYINGTAFTQSSTKTNYSTGQNDTGTGAIDLNAGAKMGNDVQNLVVNAEFVVTTSGVHGLATQNNFIGNANNIYSLGHILGWDTVPAFSSGAAVKAFNLNTAYTMPVMGHSTVFFASYDNVIQNSDNRLYMLNAGARTEVVNNVWVGGSYILAGGKMTQFTPAKNGPTTSDTKTSNTVLVDVTAYF